MLSQLPCWAGLTPAGQPTAGQLKAAAKAGYRTVIDLRPLSEDHGFDEGHAPGSARFRHFLGSRSKK